MHGPRTEVRSRHTPDSTVAGSGLQLDTEERDAITYNGLWRRDKLCPYLIVHSLSGGDAGSVVDVQLSIRI